MISSMWLLGVVALPLAAVVVLLIWQKATKMQAGVVALVSEGLTLLIVFLLLPRLRQDGAVFYSFAWIEN
ncbi:MAG: hypothetical protein H0S82_03270, partial [Anaerolineaceae bacterium]|nr:hypothetical protein [Anaerolineaceae bacterium]